MWGEEWLTRMMLQSFSLVIIKMYILGVVLLPDPYNIECYFGGGGAG